MQSYIKYKRYYDKKPKASPLKEEEYCFILQPKADHQGSKIPFRDFRWIRHYLVQKVQPNKNYIVRELNTNKLKYYTEAASENTIPNNLLKTYITKFNGRLTIIILSHRMIYTPLHGKRNLVDIYLIFLSYIVILTQLIWRKLHTGTGYCCCPALLLSRFKRWSKMGNLPHFRPAVTTTLKA